MACCSRLRRFLAPQAAVRGSAERCRQRRITGPVECESAWNKDPVFGVIGIQSGPRGSGSTMASMIHGGRDWDAYCGDDCEDPPGVFRAREVDQGDLP